MNILFSNPPWWSADETGLRQGIRAGSRWPFTRPAQFLPNQFRFGTYMPFPFFLAHAASYTQQLMPDATVAIRDSIARGEDYEVWVAALDQFKPDYLVLETATSALEHDEKVIEWLARARNRIQLILAGPIDPARAERLLAKHPNVFAVVQGEYDKQIARAINSAERKVYGHDLLTRAELLAAPFPMFDEGAALNYYDGCPTIKTADGKVEPAPAPHLQLMASRGCVYTCSFCAWPAVMTGNDPLGLGPRNVRHYSADYIERLIRSRMDRNETPLRSVYFDDDWFNNHKKHVLGICDVMRRIGLPWSAMCRADSLDRETWGAMRDSGCYGVKVGFESGSQRVVSEIINKRLDITKAAETCRWLRSIGLTVHTTFSIGHPGETPEEQQQTRDFIKMLYDTGATDTHQLSGTAVISGTPLDHIERGEKLKRYPGAVVDENYVSSPDGQKKAEELSKIVLK